LSPEEIGIYSIGAVIVGFAHVIRDFGVANYLVQEKELTIERIRTAFGITLCIAWGIALLLAILSGAIASFYSEPRVQVVILVLSISFLFIPFSSTILGLLRREMKFETLFRINFVTTIAHSLTGISLAYMGYGFQSLAWATFASSLTTVLIGILNRPLNSQFFPSLLEFKRIFSFGSFASLTSGISEIGNASSELAIGRNLDLIQVGFYSRATGLASIFNYSISAAIQPIILPTFSKTIHQGNSLKEPYLRALCLYSVLSWPFFLFLAILTLPITHILYGTQWDTSVPAARLLAIAFLFQTLVAFSSSALISMGKIKVYFYSQLIVQFPRIALTIIASFYNIYLVAAVQIFFYILCFIVFHILLHRQIEIFLIDIWKATYKSLFVAISSCIPVFISYRLIPLENNFITIAICSVLWLLSGLISIFALKHEVKHEIMNFAHQLPMTNRIFFRH
jgi:O-antigen/teichoic acid export membrane protein